VHVLLTGGAGYIGTHTAVELVKAGHRISLLDNLANSSFEAIERVRRLTNATIAFHRIDLLDAVDLEGVFATGDFDAVIHFAGLKSVGESVSQPLDYYRVNLGGTINLLQAMQRHGPDRLVFSSSATVYGIPQRIPIDEECHIIDASNPYGRTKLMIERMLEDVSHSAPQLRIARLRYFNPAGAHESGEIGEDPTGIPNNLLPYVTQVAVGRRKSLTVYGMDYPTRDGTCIRDYVHVSDLASGHVAALARLAQSKGLVTYNLGTGTGHSVLEVIRAFETANNLSIKWEPGPRRPGDIATSYTDPSRAQTELGWQATRGIEDICCDAFRWQSRNPDGYRAPV
jgi:UDP-glucose 4-epimerase